MECGVSRSGNWTVIYVNGRSDSFHFPMLKAQIEDLLGTGVTFLAIDLSRTKFLSIATIDYINRLTQSIYSQGGRLALLGATEKIKRNLSIFADHLGLLIIPQGEGLPDLGLATNFKKGAVEDLAGEEKAFAMEEQPPQL
jgi:anti-anti-sigma regulatory factor